MALNVALLSEDQLLCPICLDRFVEPVSTPCGHNFCKVCLSSYWDSSSECLCPICKEHFSHRPQLRVNTFISGLSQSFSSLQLGQEPQQDRVCPQHQQLLRSYCTEEGALLCVSCEGAHSRHWTVPLEQACRELRAQVESNEAKVSSLIQDRVQSVYSIKETKAQRHEETRRVITQSEEVLQDVLKKVQKSHKDLVQRMEEKQQQADSEAEALVVQTEQEIADLIETQTKLQELKQTKDPLLFLQKHPDMSLISWSHLSTLSLREDEELEEKREILKSCTSQIKKFLKQFNKEITSCGEKQSLLKPLQKYAVDLKLDPDTAHPKLCVSPDLKQVWYKTDPLNNNSRRFFSSYAVITDRGFSHGRFYFEVSVGQKEEWNIGLVGESVPRKQTFPKQPGRGVWILYFREDKFYPNHYLNAPVYRGKVERVGVFVDCEKGILSFYDVKTATCIYSFHNCIFEEKMYPFLNPCDDEFPSNLGPMMIVDHK